LGNPKFTLSQFFNFGKLSCPARRHLRMVAARLTNPSFTSSHDRVVCPTRARHQVATRGPPPKTHLRSQSQHFTNSPCTLAQQAGAHPSHPRTRAKSLHKLSVHPSFYCRALLRKTRVPHTCARPTLRQAGKPLLVLSPKSRQRILLRVASPKVGRIIICDFPLLLWLSLSTHFFLLDERRSLSDCVMIE